ncbi:hypothetical protein pb186bvf_011118 [Paramecium bursaria]
MSQPDRFANLVPNTISPNLWKNPSNVTAEQLQKYVSLDQIKMNQSFKNYRRSIFYVGGTLIGFLFSKFYVDSYVKNKIFGENGNGGEFLTLKTRNTIHDYTYNRQFQRMRYLTEERSPDPSDLNTSSQLLIDLGLQLQIPRSAAIVQKKVPHDKYLL